MLPRPMSKNYIYSPRKSCRAHKIALENRRQILALNVTVNQLLGKIDHVEREFMTRMSRVEDILITLTKDIAEPPQSIFVLNERLAEGFLRNKDIPNNLPNISNIGEFPKKYYYQNINVPYYQKHTRNKKSIESDVLNSDTNAADHRSQSYDESRNNHKKMKRVLSNFTDTLTMHGLPRIFTGHIVLRMLWLLFVLVAVGMSIYTCHKHWIAYSAHDIRTEIRVKNQQEILLPSITLCSKEHFGLKYLECYQNRSIPDNCRGKCGSEPTLASELQCLYYHVEDCNLDVINDARITIDRNGTIDKVGDGTLITI